MTVAVSPAANLVLRLVTIVLMIGEHPHDEVGPSASVTVTVVWAIPGGTVAVSMTR